MGRISDRFALLRRQNRAGLVAFTMGGDPSFQDSLALLRGLRAAGADVIEIGMPFSDPMADGPAIQAAGVRALAAGGSMLRTLDLVRELRKDDPTTPVVLMGYYNPILQYGPDRFARDAVAAGADGTIVVDLPPEESGPFLPLAQAAGLDFIRLATPTTDAARLPIVVQGAAGFIYYVAVRGITGTKSADIGEVRTAVGRIRQASPLPVAVGFGIKTGEQAAEIARAADAVVVGSAIVEKIAEGLQGGPPTRAVDLALACVRMLAHSVKAARVKVPAGD